MHESQHDVSATDDSSAPRTESSTGQQSASASVARLLANPRRIRRN